MYLILISIHGLIRSQQLELGRDADTGGQTQYVVDLARSLSQFPQVDRVDLITRQIFDPKVGDDYSQPREPLTDKAQIVRLACGPRRYLRKEVLWPYLDGFADELLRYLRLQGKIPHAIHSHYADAGYVGVRVANWLGVPLVHTGHSLGRVKRQRLIAQGQKPENIEKQYHFQTRIEAEEGVLEHAALIVTSTRQEIEEQYALYDHYYPDRMAVIPPGIDAQRFHPQSRPNPPIEPEITRFLADPRKPIILALSRPVPRKNLPMLLRAYGESPRLRSLANLLLILGSRGIIQEMEPPSRRVLMELLLAIDRYDLYGQVAYPKSHLTEDVADIYRLVAQSQGVLINPALTEPFGLTLIEAAACGLPIIAPADGGPRDIIANCQNGLLIDPLDLGSIQNALEQALTQSDRWQQWSRQGIQGVQENYTWESHIRRYLDRLQALTPSSAITSPSFLTLKSSRLANVDRILISDIDNTLLGDREALADLVDHLQQREPLIGFGIATGRSLDSAQKILQEWDVPTPDLWITSVGSEIHYGAQQQADSSWSRHISYRWQPEQVKLVMAKLSGIQLQTSDQQCPHKISYWVDPEQAPSLKTIKAHLRRHKLPVRVIYSHQKYLDLLPLRASKGDAVRYCAIKWGFSFERILVAGDSGNDEQMLIGNTLAVVVGNHSPELRKLQGLPQIYFATGHYAQGILEAIAHYQF
jgi:sucrose-phosphate synthase